MGDPIEIAALTKVFRASTADVGYCRIGSLKANIGHLDAAAGVASLIKTIFAIKHRELPPLVNFREPNPQLDLEHSPFVVSAEGAPWASDGKPRRAGVIHSASVEQMRTSFWRRRHYCHPASFSHGRAKLIVLSAKSATALEKSTSNLVDFLKKDQSQSLSDVEWTLQIGRRAFTHRRAVVATDQKQTVELLEQPRHPSVHRRSTTEARVRLVFYLAGKAVSTPEWQPVFIKHTPRFRRLLTHVVRSSSHCSGRTSANQYFQKVAVLRSMIRGSRSQHCLLLNMHSPAFGAAGCKAGCDARP